TGYRGGAEAACGRAAPERSRTSARCRRRHPRQSNVEWVTHEKRMALLNRDHDQDTSPSTASDLASRDLSVASYENAFVEAVYDKIAKAYDWTFGPTLHPGRLTAIQRMGIQ